MPEDKRRTFTQEFKTENAKKNRRTRNGNRNNEKIQRPFWEE